MVLITNENDWSNITTPVVENIVLGNDITFTSMPKQLNLSSYSFEGNNKTITLPTGNCSGLFDLAGGTIQNLTVNASNATSVASKGWIISGTNTTDVVYGNLTNCHTYGTISTNGSGGIVGQYFGNSNSIIQKCSSHPSIGSSDLIVSSAWCGGIAGWYFTNGLIQNCYCEGNVGNSAYNGGIAGHYFTNGTIRNCYMNGDISGVYSGGIVGLIQSGTLDRNYHIGNLTANSGGGIVGRYMVRGEGTTRSITNCYHSGTINSSSAGIIGDFDNELSTDITVYLTNCYVTASDNSALIEDLSNNFFADTNDTFIFTRCYINGSNFVKSTGDDWTLINSDSNSNLIGITGQLDPEWDTNIWAAGDDTDYPLLRGFQNINSSGSTISPLIWTGYESYISTPTFLASSGIDLSVKPIGEYLQLLDENDIYDTLTQIKMTKYVAHFNMCRQKFSQGKGTLGPYRVDWNCIYRGRLIYPAWEIGFDTISNRTVFQRQLRQAVQYSRTNVLRRSFNNFN